MSAVKNALPTPDVYYHQGGKDFYLRNDRDFWIAVNEAAVKRHLKIQGYSAEKFTTEPVSLLDQCLNTIQTKQDVNYAAPLAGYDAGIYEINNRRILVTDSPRLIQSKEGEWPLLEQIFEGMLNDPACDQRPYFYGWLKTALSALHSKKWQPGQVLAMAGPVASAKSLCQSLITEMLGGRSAQPYQFMCGATTFNADLFVAEHLTVEDVAESVGIAKRRAFGAQIKAFAVNREQHCHGKNQQALTLTPIWRVTISLNDDPERLLVLPPMDDDIADKVMLFKVTKKAMPMPTGTSDEIDAFWKALQAELPAFQHYIENWEIPEDLRSPRFGILHYHHPELLEALNALSPEMQLLEMIDKELFDYAYTEVKPWPGTAASLHARLTEQDSKVRKQADTLLYSPVACGTYLARLVTKHPDRVTKRRINGQTRYTIVGPQSELNTVATGGTVVVEKQLLSNSEDV